MQHRVDPEADAGADPTHQHAQTKRRIYIVLSSRNERARRLAVRMRVPDRHRRRLRGGRIGDVVRLRRSARLVRFRFCWFGFGVVLDRHAATGSKTESFFDLRSSVRVYG